MYAFLEGSCTGTNAGNKLQIPSGQEITIQYNFIVYNSTVNRSSMTLQETLFELLEKRRCNTKKRDFPGGPTIVQASRETICRYALNTRHQMRFYTEAYILHILKKVHDQIKH